MIYIGIDIGSTASKVAVMGDKEMNFVLPTGWSSKETILTIKEKLLENEIDVMSEDVKVVATGYGRVAVDFADYVITEITFHIPFIILSSYNINNRLRKKDIANGSCLSE